jgi:hypothetical protein
MGEFRQRRHPTASVVQGIDGYLRRWSSISTDTRASGNGRPPTSPPYQSLSTNYHRTWEIYHQAKAQITSAGLEEPLVCGIKRAVTRDFLPASEPNKFLHLWYDMVEGGGEQLSKPKPLGVSEDIAPVVRELHDLWHTQLLKADKSPGWGREFDHRSDKLLQEAGTILKGRGGVVDDTYRFTIAYGRLSMALPYVAYHTVDAIIMAFGAIPGGEGLPPQETP